MDNEASGGGVHKQNRFHNDADKMAENGIFKSRVCVNHMKEAADTIAFANVVDSVNRQFQSENGTSSSSSGL